RRRRGRLVLETDVVEAQPVEEIHRHGMQRTRLRRQAQNGLEVVQRYLGLAINVDHVAQFLQRSEDEERIDEQRKELPHGDALREDQVEHEEEDGSAQQVDASALYEAQAAQVAH